MAIRIGINGFGRISRVVIRIAAQDPDTFQIAAINYRNVDLDYMVYMLKYDTVFGRFSGTLDKYEEGGESGLVINGQKVPVIEGQTPIPWGKYGADYIIEGTGQFTSAEKAQMHLDGGAKKVIITAPAKDKTPTFVMGVNHEDYRADMQIVSNASCTTNCLAPVLKVIQDNYGIESGLMTTIHAVTAKQMAVDARSQNDWRRGRSVFGNIIPTTTGAAKAVGLVIPEVQGKLTGMAVRVPTADVSLVDVTVNLQKDATYEDICQKMKEASETNLKGVLGYTEDEVVSSDFIGEPCTSVFDAKAGLMIGDRMAKIISWYDNEYGYSKKILELCQHMAEVDAAAGK
jgi:glyceraldehyde 3-phosphate dehydrogenase